MSLALILSSKLSWSLITCDQALFSPCLPQKSEVRRTAWWQVKSLKDKLAHCLYFTNIKVKDDVQMVAIKSVS